MPGSRSTTDRSRASPATGVPAPVDGAMTTGAPTVYSQCGLRLRSEIDVSLPTIDGSAWDVDVVWGPDVDDTNAARGDLVASYELRDSTWYTATATSTGYRLQFTNCGEFEISADLARVVVRIDPSGSHPTSSRSCSPGRSARSCSPSEGRPCSTPAQCRSTVPLWRSSASRVSGKTTVAALMCVQRCRVGRRRPRHGRHRTAGHVHGRRGRAAPALGGGEHRDARPGDHPPPRPTVGTVADRGAARAVATDGHRRAGAIAHGVRGGDHEGSGERRVRPPGVPACTAGVCPRCSAAISRR
jgi:hypothetical protein